MRLLSMRALSRRALSCAYLGGDRHGNGCRGNLAGSGILEQSSCAHSLMFIQHGGGGGFNLGKVCRRDGVKTGHLGRLPRVEDLSWRRGGSALIKRHC